MLGSAGDYMKFIRLIAISLLFCISHAIAATFPEGMQALDPKTQSAIKLYMSSKKIQGDAYAKAMTDLARESPNICIRYLAAKSLEEKTGPDALTRKSQTLGKVQLKKIFTDLAKDPDKFKRDCAELKSAFGENVIKAFDDPYSDFINNEVNPLLQRNHRIYMKLRAAEYSDDPLQLIDLLQDPYINDENREQILLILKTKYSHLPAIVERGLLEVFQTANTLSLKESCLNQLLTASSNEHWCQSGLEIIEKTTRAGNSQFCPILEKAKISSEWPELEKMKMRLLSECKVFNASLPLHERVEASMHALSSG